MRESLRVSKDQTIGDLRKALQEMQQKQVSSFRSIVSVQVAREGLVYAARTEETTVRRALPYCAAIFRALSVGRDAVRAPASAAKAKRI